MLRELVADDDGAVVQTALRAVHRLAEPHPELALEIALDASIGTDQRLAESLCMAIHPIADRLTAHQAERLLDKLSPVTRLDYWGHQVLAAISPQHRENVLDFLLERAAAGGGIQALSVQDYDADLLGGASGDELLGLLRRVRDASLEADPRFGWQLDHLFWRLGIDLDASLTVLLEWLLADEEAKVEGAVALMTDMPWTATLTHTDFVERALNAAHARGSDSLNKVQSALFSITVLYGNRSRTMGHAPPRDIRVRDEARECAEHFDPASPARRFYEALVTQAEKHIKEAALQDEEYPEIGH